MYKRQLLSLPFIRIQNPYQKSFFKEKPFFKDAFPVLYQMFGNQFNPINLKIVENNQYPYNVEVSFSYLGTNYSFKEHESDLEPVSYTHLDVYKRQVLVISL